MTAKNPLSPAVMALTTKVRRTAFLCALALCLLTSCSEYDLVGMFFGQSPTADERFESSSSYNASHPIAEIKASKENYSFHLCTDIHFTGDYGPVNAFVAATLSDTASEHFSICLGDFVSEKGNFPAVKKALEPLGTSPRIFFPTPGNHDLYFGQWADYESAFHTSSYVFTVVTASGKRDRYICLDSADGTLGTLQRAFLESELDRAVKEGCRRKIVFTHTHFFKDDNSQGHTSNYILEETYDLLNLMGKYGVDCVLTGHDHNWSENRFRGVQYYTLNCLTDKDSEGYHYIATVSDEGVTLKGIIYR